MSMEINSRRELVQRAHICRVGLGDVERINRFYDMLLPQTRKIFGSYRFTRDHAEEIVQTNLNENDKRHYIVTLPGEEGSEDGTVIGLYWFWKWTKKVPWFGIMIADLYQGQGLGRQMMAHAIAEAKSCDKGGILLTTAKTNLNAQSLYKRFRFETIGEGTNKEILMILNLPDPAYSED